MSRATARSRPGVHRRARPPADLGHPRAAVTAERARGRADQQAALLLGQVRGDQLVEPAQCGIDVRAATDRLVLRSWVDFWSGEWCANDG
jgi:hypothetical protein